MLCVEYRGQRRKQEVQLELHIIRQEMTAAWVLVVSVEMTSVGLWTYFEGSTKYRECDEPRLYLKLTSQVL